VQRSARIRNASTRPAAKGSALSSARYGSAHRAKGAAGSAGDRDTPGGRSQPPVSGRIRG